MSLNIEDVLGIFIPIVFFLVLALLVQLPVIYAGIRKLINDFNAAKADGNIDAEEFKLLADDLISIITVLKSGYLWLFEYLKKLK